MKVQNNQRITIVTEFKQTRVITGGNIFLSDKDARALYKLTEMKSEEQMQESLYQCRDILRSIAKTILFTGGETTDVNELAASFIHNEMPLNSVKCHPIEEIA
jgi:hypothetical protein